MHDRRDDDTSAEPDAVGDRAAHDPALDDEVGADVADLGHASSQGPEPPSDPASDGDEDADDEGDEPDADGEEATPVPPITLDPPD